MPSWPKIQHALHAYTPAEQKAVKAAADSFRENPAFDTREAISQLGIGEALVSFLDKDGVPSAVRRAKILPPQSLMGPISQSERTAQTQGQMLYSKYGTMIDRDSAYEFFQRKLKQQEELGARKKEQEKAEREAQKEALRQEKEREKEEERRRREEIREKERKEKALAREAQQREQAKKKAVASVAKTAAGTIGREVGNEIGKNVGGSFGKKLGGNLGASIGRGLLGTLFGK